MHIVEGGLDDPRVVDLLHTHPTRARPETAPGSAHALDLSGLRTPNDLLIRVGGRRGRGRRRAQTAEHGSR
jgi:hypothetical protein